VAITATTGGTINNSSAGTTLTFSSFSATATQDIVVAVAILTTAVSVSTVTDTAGNTYTLKSQVNNSTSVRAEIWEAHSITANASNVIVVTLSGSSLASAAFEEYAGASSGVGLAGTTATGTSANPEGHVATQDGNNWSAGCIAVASSSGDTFTANLGTIRRSLVPALTTAGVALIDNSSAGLVTLRNAALLSASRAWAAVGFELRTGAAAIAITPALINAPNSGAGAGANHQVVKAPPMGTSGGGGSSNYGFVG
jgi:hypothetical protein